MRTKVTLVLLLLNVVLFFVIFRVERAWRTESVAMEVRHRVLGAEAADIRELAVTTPAPGGSYRLERRGESWYLTRPWVWRANPIAVHRIIGDLQFLDDETSFSVADVERDGQRLSDYGLDPPAATVTFTSGGADTTGARPVTTTLRIGSATKIGDRLYLLSPDGRRIHVVRRELVQDLSLTPDQLRSPAVVTIPYYEAGSLNLQTSSGSRILIQRDSSGWTFETPISARADANQIEATVDALDALRASSFAPGGPPLASAGAVRVTIEGDNRRETLFLGTEPDPSGAVPAQLEDDSEPGGRTVRFAVEVPAGLRRALADPVDRLRDPHVLAFDSSAVTAVTLQEPGQPTLQLQRLEPASAAGEPVPAAGWQMLLPGHAGQPPRIIRASAQAVRGLLGELQRLSAEQSGRQFRIHDAPSDADLENWGFNRPERTIVLTLASAGSAPATSVTIQIAHTGTADTAEARVGNAPSVYEVDPDILRETPVAPLAWRDRQLRMPDAARVVRLALTDLSTGKTLWTWPGADLTGARAGAAQALASELLNLRASRFVADGFDPGGANGRPWRYRLDSTFALPEGGAGETQSQHAMYFGERTGGSEQLAGSAEFDATFIPEQAMVDVLWTLTYGSRDPGAPLAAGAR